MPCYNSTSNYVLDPEARVDLTVDGASGPEEAFLDSPKLHATRLSGGRESPSEEASGAIPGSSRSSPETGFILILFGA